jgi:hypothetical protein
LIGPAGGDLAGFGAGNDDEGVTDGGDTDGLGAGAGPEHPARKATAISVAALACGLIYGLQVPGLAAYTTRATSETFAVPWQAAVIAEWYDRTVLAGATRADPFDAHAARSSALEYAVRCSSDNALRHCSQVGDVFGSQRGAGVTVAPGSTNPASGIVGEVAARGAGRELRRGGSDGATALLEAGPADAGGIHAAAARGADSADCADCADCRVN